MTKTVLATYDGTVLKPDEPLGLPADCRVEVTVSVPDAAVEAGSFLQTARLLELEGPPEWSETFEEELYGGAPRDGAA